MAEMAMKTTMSTRMISTCRSSLIFLKKMSRIKSMVSVELDAMTREERVDMEADNTRITVRAIRAGLKFSSIVGMMESYPPVAMSI